MRLYLVYTVNGIKTDETLLSVPKNIGKIINLSILKLDKTGEDEEKNQELAEKIIRNNIFLIDKNLDSDTSIRLVDLGAEVPLNRKSLFRASQNFIYYDEKVERYRIRKSTVPDTNILNYLLGDKVVLKAYFIGKSFTERKFQKERFYDIKTFIDEVYHIQNVEPFYFPTTDDLDFLLSTIKNPKKNIQKHCVLIVIEDPVTLKLLHQIKEMMYEFPFSNNYNTLCYAIIYTNDQIVEITSNSYKEINLKVVKRYDDERDQT